MTVHAHPDDETITTGGVMARYAAEGLRVVNVTCTYGENGEIVVPELDTPESHARLGEIRQQEMARALEALAPGGGIEQRWLGYRDSGMMGTPENEDPRAFWQADLAEATGRLVRLVREVRPDVIVGYNAFGGYGHPDHIRAGEIARRAFEAAGDTAAYPEQLADGELLPWAPSKLYEGVFDLSRRDGVEARLRALGIEPWWLPKADETPEQRAEREAWQAQMAAATGPLTTSVDVGEVLPRKLEALRAHVTQIAAGDPFLALGVDGWREFQPAESFTLAVSRVGVRLPEDDLFAGLR